MQVGQKGMSVALGTPCGIWPQQVVRVRFSYLEEEGKAIKEAEGLHLGLLSSRDG
jgi:hypothetical protein